MTADDDKLARAKKVAEHVRRAAEELTAAADELPVCDCAVLDEEHMARVVHDLGKAERAVINVHSGLRLLEQKHEGGPVGLATLETQPLEGLPAPGQPRILEQVAGLAEQAANESTGGQCC